ncbi:MAG: YkgJ family cysteine cluster protein [Myxococcaceae bacterium]|nr:YkgJ family cysteine cluster protein [Myxococcaceae bacterium]MCA3012544.1 YkgJ family cysteine cluster protein [Myxococcaceae bacterium]
MSHACTGCGACCVAPDIAALDKPLGLACPHLGPDHRCTVYERRPQVCRDYQPDELCERIAAPTLDARVARYLAHFGLTDEAATARDSGLTSRAALLARHGVTPPR